MDKETDDRLTQLEADVAEAGTPTDTPHTSMATEVAEATVTASEKAYATHLKWFAVILIVGFFVVLLLVKG